MAHPQVAALPLKISSYAKIAAMPAPNLKMNSNVIRKDVQQSPSQPPAKTLPAINGTNSPKPQNLPTFGIAQPISEAAISSMQKLSVQDLSKESPSIEHNADSTDSYEEDQSQVSSSSLNKPQSFDTKSLASVTTFAMDDKESIRPDDSASVRAVDDENPHPTLSRNSSFQQDADQPPTRSARVFPSTITIPGRRFPTLANPPRFGNLPISPVLECQDVQMPSPSVQVMSPEAPREASTTVPVQPDEKLLDALASVKDRLPLLQLEEKVLAFLHDTKSDVLDLPPQNSFNRLLTHKLADYYQLAHVVSDDNSSVRILRATPSSLPTPLTEVARAIPPCSMTAPTSTAVKIMRREQLNNRHFSAGNSTAPSSSVPSKATSENGVEGRSDDGLTSPAESTPSRDKSKMTREEREAQYKIARDRIFADFQESLTHDVGLNEDNSASMSRSSSSSGKKKSNNNKKHKQPKDDSFEARSAYVASYAPLQTQYASNNHGDASLNGGYPTSPVNFEQNVYGNMPMQQYPGYDANYQYPNMQAYHPAMMQQFQQNEWQAMQAMHMQNPYMMYPQAMQYPNTAGMVMPGMQSPQSQIPEWYPGQMNGYAGQTHTGSSTPFLPPTAGDPRSPAQEEAYQTGFQRSYFSPSQPSSHHGHKGTKSLFNPQTRSFVPNTSDGRPGSRSNRHKNQPRNGLNSSIHHSANNSNVSIIKEDTLKQRYGTPPSLPKKPPAQGTRQVQESASAMAAPSPVPKGENNVE